jgi:hypothetical protein
MPQSTVVLVAAAVRLARLPVLGPLDMVVEVAVVVLVLVQ